jgi:CHAP domain
MMADWWDSPYKTGKPVPVPGFPRSVYPPDAADKGKVPSSPGPDIEAYKRVVSRAGRWPWQEFDESFSNAFSHGKSGNVAETGVAGVQRQQGIDATGWIGPSTFDIYRRIKVPMGKPHAGEMCMDVTAQNLIAEAWTMFGGKPTPPPPSKTTREHALEGAASHVGYKEKPAGSNNTKFGAWYGVNYQPWCAIFVTYCYEIEANGSPSFERGSQYAYCPYILQDARNNRNGLTVTTSPMPGDIVLFDWGRDGTYDHTGFFDKWTDNEKGLFDTIEGNTGDGNDSNGGAVMRRTRNVRNQATVFVRVREP